MRTWHRRITLCIDLFYVAKNGFFCSTSRNINFHTIQPLESESYGKLLSRLQTIIDLFTARGFEVQHVRGDGQFECLEDSIRPIHMHIAAPGQHVPEIERTIRTIKEDVRSTINSLPYSRFTKLMIRHVVKFHVRLRNTRINTNSACRDLNPYTIMTGKTNPSFHDYKLEFGAYAQVSEHPDNLNSTEPRTTGAISLGPSNDEGGWHFMSLISG